MNPLLQKLTGGDRRSIGRSDEVAAEVLAQPALFPLLFEGMLSDDPLIRMRAADAVEKITAQQPGYLQPYKNQLLAQVAPINQQEVRWHVAQMLPRLNLNSPELAQAVEILLAYLDDPSKIVKTFAMQALADLAEQEASLRPQVIKIVAELTQTGSPAVQSRGRKLLRRLSREAETRGGEAAKKSFASSPHASSPHHLRGATMTPTPSPIEAQTAATITTIRQFNDALNRRDVEAMMALLTDDCVFDNTYPAPDGTRYEGQARVRAFWSDFFAAAAHIELETEEIFAAGERGVMRWVYRWVSQDGQPGHVRGVDVYRVQNGQIAEKLSYVKG